MLYDNGMIGDGMQGGALSGLMAGRRSQNVDNSNARPNAQAPPANNNPNYAINESESNNERPQPSSNSNYRAF